jgi:hypothetical protein
MGTFPLVAQTINEWSRFDKFGLLPFLDNNIQGELQFALEFLEDCILDECVFNFSSLIFNFSSIVQFQIFNFYNHYVNFSFIMQPFFFLWCNFSI